MTEMEEKDKVPSELGEWLDVEIVPSRDGRPGYEIVIGFKGEVGTETLQRAVVEIQWRGTQVQALIMNRLGGDVPRWSTDQIVLNLAADWPA